MPDKNPIQAANDFIKKGIDAAGAGRPDEARQHFEHSLDFVANNYIALKNLAALAAQQEAFADAEGFLNRIAFEDTTWESWFDLARVRFAQENFDGAKEACVEALTQDSSNTTVLKHLADIETHLGNHTAATEVYGEIASILPTDKAAVMTFAQRIQADDPGKARDLLMRLKTSLERPSDRLRVLQELVLLSELAGRKSKGQALNHATNYEDSRFIHGMAALEELKQCVSAILKDEPDNRQAILSLGCCDHAMGDRVKAQECFDRLSGQLKDHIGSCVKLNDDFLQGLASTEETDITRHLPDLVTIHSIKNSRDPVVVVSSDYRYFFHFARPLIMSLQRNMPGVKIHVHVMDTVENDMDDVKNWCQRVENIQLGLTAETTGLFEQSRDQALCYYHAVRFVRLYQWRQMYDGPLWMIDADALANKNPQPLLQETNNWDVALRVRPGRFEPWNIMSAGLIGIAPTDKGRQFLRLTAAYIAHYHSTDGLAWGIDQLALLAAFYATDECKLRFLSGREQDVELQEHGLFWFLSGQNKVLFPDLALGPDRTLNKLSERDQRFARLYLQYLS